MPEATTGAVAEAATGAQAGQDPIRLVCLPFGGSGTSFFRPWDELTGGRFEVLPLRLPGREHLIDVEPYRDVHRATDGLLADLLEELGGPAGVVLFGHSVGAVLAYELAQRLRAVPEVEVLRLIVSGSPEPGTQRTLRATGLPDDAFLERVGEIAGYSHDAMAVPELRELLLPTLRADVEMHEAYRPSTLDPLPVPITALRGAEDQLVPRAQAAAWREVTAAGFDLHEPAGGHMYLVDGAASLVSLIDKVVHGSSAPK
ncbi:alpha/beta fold hydrolase [Streptomyces sp. JH002]|uniref:thioesterase II family protein n=1 Tax=Streptomyces sp. JH002 TaxID=2763259 RepID=UPI003D807F74